VLLGLQNFYEKRARGELKKALIIANEPYVLEKVWEKVEVDNINVVIANGINK
jgi:hypothetical protein